jgi:hypothetical protein
VPDDIATTIARFVDELDGPRGAGLRELLAPAEHEAIGDRARTFLRKGKYPVPDEGYHSVPWPLV